LATVDRDFVPTAFRFPTSSNCAGRFTEAIVAPSKRHNNPLEFCAFICHNYAEAFVAEMTDEEIDKLFAATDKAVEPLGYSRFEDIAVEMSELIAKVTELAVRFKDRKLLREWLRSLPNNDPGPSELEFMLQVLPNLVYTMRASIPSAIKQFMPHDPGGRPSAATLKLRQRICKEIGELLVKGVRLSKVYERLARRHGVSARTIQRIWNEREKQ
jgi:hypothetical protein